MSMKSKEAGDMEMKVMPVVERLMGTAGEMMVGDELSRPAQYM